MKPSWLLAPLLVFALAAPVSAQAPASAPLFARAATGRSLTAVVVDNHDGDTLTVKLSTGKVERVRLIGVDTAEMAQGLWAERARDFTRRQVLGKAVRLQFDVEERDRYGRLLAYVYTPDGKCLNLELVRQGYAMVLTYPPNVAHTAAFVAAQREARARRLNIWGEGGLSESPKSFRHHDHSRPQTQSAPAKGGLVSLNTRSHKYHNPGCRAYDCKNCEPMTEAEAIARGGKPCKLCH